MLSQTQAKIKSDGRNSPVTINKSSLDKKKARQLARP
jgi:hypothetical protein